MKSIPKSWVQIFGANFTGADGTLVGNWLLGVLPVAKTASNYNNMARGEGSQGGQLGLTDTSLNITNVNKIKITAKVSNLNILNTN